MPQAISLEFSHAVRDPRNDILEVLIEHFVKLVLS